MDKIFCSVEWHQQRLESSYKKCDKSSRVQEPLHIMRCKFGGIFGFKGTTANILFRYRKEVSIVKRECYKIDFFEKLLTANHISESRKIAIDGETSQFFLDFRQVGTTVRAAVSNDTNLANAISDTAK